MKSILSSIKNWLAVGNRSKWCLFFLFVFTLFVKTMIFHWSCFHSVLISSLWKNTPEFFRFWSGKLIPCLFLGAFVFISKRDWWTIIACILTDIWLTANLFYFNANQLFLSVDVMMMADNMGGFWSSLLSYVNSSMFILPLISVAYIAAVVPLRNNDNHRHPILFSVWLGVSIILMVLWNLMFGMYSDSWTSQNSATAQVNSRMLKDEEFYYYFPFGHTYYYACVESCVDYNEWSKKYIKEYSIISYLPACGVYYALVPAGQLIELTDMQQNDIKRLILPEKDQDISPRTNIVFILFESMEAWPLNEVCGFSFMPNLQRLTQQDHVLYCDKLKSQTKHGNSADGQMIDVTGMLPIANGAACRLFGRNKYPNYAHLFASSTFFKANSGLWNQQVVSKSYEFDNLVEPTNGDWNDGVLIDTMIAHIGEMKEPFCAVGFTINSHVPFSYGAEHKTYCIEGMPAMMSAYLNCVYFTDSCIGVLLDTIMNSDLRNNTTIVISGDHTIFRGEDAELDAFAKAHGINFQSTHTFTPLIVYSPTIEGNICVTDTCYQMDIFPTILSLIGAEDHYWHGFGVNIMDSTARHNRPISEDDAYHLSDLMIRSDYFRQYLAK